jgi:hypothetical protein
VWALGVVLAPPGPKLYLRRVKDEEEKNDEGMKIMRGERERLSIRRQTASGGDWREGADWPMLAPMETLLPAPALASACLAFFDMDHTLPRMTAARSSEHSLSLHPCVNGLESTTPMH